MAPRPRAAPIAARPGDAGADDQHLRRRHAAGGGHLAGEEPAVEAGRFDDRAIAGDVGHRRQRVHLLGARDARDLVDGDRGDFRDGEPLDQRLVLARPEEADERGPRPQQVGFVHAQRAMLLGRLDLQDDVGLVPELPRVGDDGRARPRVVVVGERGADAGVGSRRGRRSRVS